MVLASRIRPRASEEVYLPQVKDLRLKGFINSKLVGLFEYPITQQSRIIIRPKWIDQCYYIPSTFHQHWVNGRVNPSTQSPITPHDDSCCTGPPRRFIPCAQVTSSQTLDLWASDCLLGMSAILGHDLHIIVEDWRSTAWSDCTPHRNGKGAMYLEVISHPFLDKQVICWGATNIETRVRLPAWLKFPPYTLFLILITLQQSAT